MNSPILYVEDEEDDALLLKFGFERAGIAQEINVVSDGQQAIDYLCGNKPFSDRQEYPLPCLLLLDLNLPGRSGFDVLGWLETQPELKSLPVVVITSSANKQDVELARKYGVKGYLLKKANLNQIADMAKDIKSRWLDPLTDS